MAATAKSSFLPRSITTTITSAMPLKALLLTLLIASSNAVMQITETTEWTENRNLTEQIIIQADQTLTIRGPDAAKPIVIDLHNMDNTGGGFLISANAKLIVENAILTRWNEEFNINAVSFAEELTGSVQLTNVRCQHMGTCIALKKGNMFEINHSIFRHNHRALDGANTRAEIVRTSLFVENEIGVAGDEWILEDCVLLRNNEASSGERTKFVRTLFLENEKAAVDPNDVINRDAPFLTDCLFYKNVHGVVPNCCGTPHAGMEGVSFIDNEVAVYDKTELSNMTEVNLINSTEWNLVYAGNGSVDASGEIYWGALSIKGIRAKLFDSHQGSGGGTVHVRQFSKTPFLHDLLVQMLLEQPTSLLKDLESFLLEADEDWKPHAEESTEQRQRSKFDFTKLREWENGYQDVVLETQADETTEMEEVKDSDNIMVEVPKDVADGSDTKQQEEPSSTQSVEDSKKEQHHGPYDTHNKTASSRLEIRVHDDDQWILFVSLGFNICFVWIISVIGFDCCCKPKMRSYFYKQVVESDDEAEEEDLLANGDAEEIEEGTKTL